jgi:predicted transcriptional regulator
MLAMPNQGEDRDKLLGPLEREVMQIIWGAGEPMSVRQLLSAINDGRDQPLAYTTIMTVMSRLVDKDVLSRAKQGRGYRYEATADDAAGMAVRNVVRDYGDAAMAHFVEEARADPKVLRRLRKLLADDS